MSELVIQYHNFENAKEELKKFSEQTVTDLDLKKVNNVKDVGEFIGDWFLGRGIGLNHKVTGEELNDLTIQIQTHFHSINHTQIKLIKEFGQVYSALEALDQDYIQAILVSIKATEETSKSIQETQGQIKKIVENQRKTLEELKKFKQKLDGYAHLGDIDKIWSDCQSWYKEINALSKSLGGAVVSSKESVKKADAVKTALTAVEKKIVDLSKQSSSLIERLESIQNTVSENKEDINILHGFTEKLSGIKHLMEVDDIWKQMEVCQLRIKELEQTDEIQMGKLEELAQADNRIFERIDVNTGGINRLKQYKEKLSSMSHLDDVDSMWEDVEEHASQLFELENRDEGLAAAIQKNKEETDEEIADTVQKTNAAVASLTKRIKYAYLIAGGSAGLAMIELLLLLMKVI